MTEREPHFDISPVFVPVAAMLRAVDGNIGGLPKYPLLETVHELCECARGQLKDNGPTGVAEAGNDLEYQTAHAVLTAIGALALIGADYHLDPPGGMSDRYTPDSGDALAYAILLCDLAQERWPTPPLRWYEDPNDEAPDIDDSPEDDDADRE